MNAPDEVPLEVSCETVRQMMQSGVDFTLLDCRERDEWEIVRIAPAKLIPMSELQERLSELGSDYSRNIIVYCHHGIRSRHVAAWLRSKSEFHNVQSMTGGIDAWSVRLDPSLPRY